MIPTTDIVIVDDSWLIRQGIRCMLEQKPGFRIVGEAATNRELRAMLETRPADVILLDIELSDGPCFDTLGAIKEKYPTVAVVVLTHFKDVSNIVKAVKSGANAYLPKDCSPEELMLAIGMVEKGKGLFLGETISPETLKQCFTGNIQPKNCKPYNLTDREIEVVELLAKGYQTKEIAALMNIHQHTVESHKENIKQKLGKNTAIEIVLFAFCNGIISN